MNSENKYLSVYDLDCSTAYVEYDPKTETWDVWVEEYSNMGEDEFCVASFLFINDAEEYKNDLIGRAWEIDGF